jgi:hypothetical protein
MTLQTDTVIKILPILSALLVTGNRLNQCHTEHEAKGKISHTHPVHAVFMLNCDILIIMDFCI